MIFLAVAAKDLKSIARDRAALLFTVLVPLIVITIVAGTLGGSNEETILLPIVNEDEGPVAEALIEILDEHLRIVEVDAAAARRLIGQDKQAGTALVLPAGLSKRYLSGRPTTLTLLIDPAKGTELNTVKAYLLLADKEAAALADPLSEELLVVKEESVSGDRLKTTSFEQNVPGFSVMFVLMGVLFGVAFGMRDERDYGTVTRIRSAPVSRFSFFGGKLLARFVVGVLQMLLLFGFGHLAFGISLGRSYVTFLVLTAAVVFSMTAFSLVVACFARTREQIIPLGLTIIMIVCAIGGCWWPLFMEPVWLQHAARLTLTAWAMDAISDLILRDRGLMDVLPAIGILVAYGVASLFAGIRFYRLAE